MGGDGGGGYIDMWGILNIKWIQMYVIYDFYKKEVLFALISLMKYLLKKRSLLSNSCLECVPVWCLSVAVRLLLTGIQKS